MVQHRAGRGRLGVEHPLRHRLQQRHVAAEADLQELVGEPRAPAGQPARGLRVLVPLEPCLGQGVHGDDARPVPLGLLQRGEHAGVVGAGVLAHDHDQVGQREVVVGDRRLPDADRLAEGGAGGLVAHVGAVGQVVGAEGAHEQLVDERSLVRRAPARVERRLVGGVEGVEPVGDDRERLVPRDGDVVVGPGRLVHGLDEPPLLPQPVLGPGAEVRDRVLGPERRLDDERRRLPRHGLGAVLAELRGLAPVRVRPGAAHAVEAVAVVHRQQQAGGARRSHVAQRRDQRVDDAGHAGRPVLRRADLLRLRLPRLALLPDVVRLLRGHAASPLRCPCASSCPSSCVSSSAASSCSTTRCSPA